MDNENFFNVRYKKCLYIFFSLLYQAFKKVECPFCGNHYRKFVPEGVRLPLFKEKKIVGGGYRENVRCPSCHSFDRHRLVYLYLKNKTRIFKDELRVLHIAPEWCLQKILINQPNIKYITADLNAKSVMVQMDITQIPFENNSFDVIICNHVLEHIEMDRLAMKELYRVLAPGGWAILQVPISLSLERTYEDSRITTMEDREQFFGQGDHVRIYAKDYKYRLEDIGFSVEVYNYSQEFGLIHLIKHALIKEEKLYICRKST